MTPRQPFGGRSACWPRDRGGGLVLEVHSATSAGLITGRTWQDLTQRKIRLVNAEKRVETVCLDASYIGT